ncbi:MAG: ABC transporter permease, partial [Acidimicrobiales bacterium]
LHNVAVKKLRLALTALAIAIAVVTVVSLGVVTSSLESSELAIMQTGRADFTVAQRGVSDILNSSIDQAESARIAAEHGVAAVVGVLIGTARLNAANPQFLEIGIDPAQFADFGVTVVAGRPFAASATDEVMLGWRAAENLGRHVGDRVQLDSTSYRVVGIYSTGQALGDAGAMLPLTWFQTYQRQPGQLTLLFVQAAPGTNIADLQARIDRDNPHLVTVRTAEQFGRADRSLSLIRAADRGSTVLAVVIGAIVVMCAMTMSFVERMREFGVLAAIGWPRRRVMAMIVAEALVIGLLGAAVGSVLAVVAVRVVQHLPSLAGVLHPDFTAAVFARALYTAAAMSLLGGLYPALRAALTGPMEELRNE